MRLPGRFVAFAALLVGLLSVAAAQHGHPLVGTWSGYWGPNDEERNRVLLLLEYDGERIGGIINPGPNPVPITSALLDAPLDGRGRSCRMGRIEAASGAYPRTPTVTLNTELEYRIEIAAGSKIFVTSPSERSISGEWVQGDVVGDFSVTLN